MICTRSIPNSLSQGRCMDSYSRERRYRCVCGSRCQGVAPVLSSLSSFSAPPFYSVSHFLLYTFLSVPVVVFVWFVCVITKPRRVPSRGARRTDRDRFAPDLRPIRGPARGMPLSPSLSALPPPEGKSVRRQTPDGSLPHFAPRGSVSPLLLSRDPWFRRGRACQRRARGGAWPPPRGGLACRPTRRGRGERARRRPSRRLREAWPEEQTERTS